jgi:hypothetical protein
MIFDTADLQRTKVVFPGDTANKGPDTFFNVLMDEFGPGFCAEDNVIEELGVCVCHMGRKLLLRPRSGRMNLAVAFGATVSGSTNVAASAAVESVAAPRLRVTNISVA